MLQAFFVGSSEILLDLFELEVYFYLEESELLGFAKRFAVHLEILVDGEGVEVSLQLIQQEYLVFEDVELEGKEEVGSQVRTYLVHQRKRFR